MLNVLIQADVYDPATGTTVAIAAASHDDPAVCHANGGTWWPAIAKLPKLQYDLFDGAFGNQITSPATSLTLQAEPWANFGRYAFADARFRLWTGDVSDPANVWTLRFDGRVTDQPQLENGAAALSIAVDDRWLDAPLLATYAGTTGAEGPLAMKGQVKPLALGAPRYVPGTLIDSVNSVFQVSGYGAIQEFEAALERGIRFAAPIADYPTYAALVAATIPPGAWATAKAVGMARFGAPTSGLVSFLIKGDVAGPNGWARKPGQLIRRIALIAGGAGKIDDASLDALDAACPYNLSYYVDQQTTARQLIQQIAASVNAVAGVSWLGKLFVIPVKINAPALTLAADGSALPPVGSVQQIAVSPPFKKLAIGAERTWAVHALSDIAFTAELLPLGAYNALTIYREGNITDAADGSRFLYISTAPGAGHAPPAATFPPTAPASNAYWKQIAPPTTPIAPNGTTLISLISDAQSDASAALDGLAEAGDDGKLTGQEKIQKLIPGNAELEAAWTLLDTQAAAVSGFGAVGTARTTAAAARTAWIVYRDALSPAWNNTNLTTAVTRATYNGKIGDYRYALELLSDALRQYAQTRADWGGVTGSTRPADNAGTSGVLTPLGSGSTVRGNTVTKTSGTHGAFEGGAVGMPMKGTAFVSGSLLSATAGGGWFTILALDNTFSNFGGADFTYSARYISFSAGGGTVYLYNGSTQISAIPVTGVTDSSRMTLVYDGTSVFVLLDGVQRGSVAAASGQTLCPKVIDYHRSDALARGVIDIIYGPWTDQSQAKAAQADATSALSSIANIQSDNVLSKGEKSEIIRQWVNISGEATGIINQATGLGLSAAAYNNAVNALATYLSALSPGWSDTTQDTPIVGTTFRSKFQDAYDTKQALLNAIDLKASQLATWSGVTGSGRPADGATNDVSLTVVGTVSAIGNTISRSAGDGDYGAMVRSAAPITGPQTAGVNIYQGAAWTMVGLGINSATSYADQACTAHYNYGTGQLNIYVNGASAYGVTIGSAPGRLEVSWDGKRFSVQAGGGFAWQSKLQTGVGALYGKFWAYNTGIAYTGLSYWPDALTPTGTATLYDARNEAVVGSNGNIWEIKGSTAIYHSTGGWIGNAYSLESFKGTAALSARFIGAGDTIMVGLSNNRTWGGGTTEYIYGSYLIYNAGGALYAYESGNGFSLGTSFTGSCTVAVTYDGVNVRYYVDGALKRTTPATAGLTLFACLSSAAANSTVADIQFGGYSQNDWGSIGGSGRPEDNADVTLTSQFTIDIGNAIDVNFEYTGTTASGLPKSLPVVVTRGGTNVTTSPNASYTVSNFQGGCTNANVTVDNGAGSSTKGRPTVLAGSAAPGTFDWTLTYNGVVVSVVTVKVNKKVADAPAGSGSGSGGFTKSGTFDGGGLAVGSTSFAEVNRVSNITVASGESLYASFSSTYYVSGTGNFVSRYLIAKFQRSPAGTNSWTDFGTQVTGTNAQTYNINSDQYAGSISVNQTSAPGAGNYDVRLVVAENSSANSSVIATESPSPASVIAKV